MKKKVKTMEDVIRELPKEVRRIDKEEVPSIGGLHFCHKCYNVHRPGRCVNLGILPSQLDEWRKKDI